MHLKPERLKAEKKENSIALKDGYGEYQEYGGVMESIIKNYQKGRDQISIYKNWKK